MRFFTGDFQEAKSPVKISSCSVARRDLIPYIPSCELATFFTDPSLRTSLETIMFVACL
jgi:hypothetical protein